MTVKFVNQESGDQGLTTSHARNYTPGSGVNLVVVTLTVGNAISGLTITYGSTPMTLLDFGSNTAEIYIYYLVNPPAGASTVTASWTTARNNSLAIRGYSGVNTTNPFGVLNKTSGTSNTISVDVTSNLTELVIDSVANMGANFSVGTNQTQEYNTNVNMPSAGSSEAGAATVNMSWSLTGSVAWVTLAVPIRAQTSFFLMF